MTAEPGTNPYRVGAPTTERRVIARLGRGALAAHGALSLVGLSMPLWVGVLIDEVPAIFVLMVMATPLGLLGLGRAVHASFVPHSIEIDDNGLRLAWGKRVFAMPWLAKHDHEVPWSALQGVRVHTVSVNGFATTTLEVTTDGGVLEVPDDRFDRSAQQIQRDILDFVDRKRERPPTSAYAQRMRERFPVPEYRQRSPLAMVGATAFFVPFIGFPIFMAIATPFWLTYGFAALASVLFGGLTVLGWRNWWRERVFGLGPDGISIGPVPARARLIRWDDIELVRRETTNGKLDALDIVEHGGTHTSLRHDYGYGLAALAQLIDPHARAPW